ncbi:hypothetical protein BZA03_1197 [Alteromonas sp. I10]|uniref:CPBP family intramembrane glutamic endopeptidase n=1 Tax=Alteromonas TaxID=226 RepID=UPI000D753EE6|nr:MULTISPECIES: CPBP family intramembrane glutamic endopeptidase [Alteromonas]PXW68136.1 hypothetical protein BZA03_1197 [Alteromonas sp. I10]
MDFLEIVLLTVIFLFPFLDIALEKYKLKTKIQEYWKLSIMLWLVTAFLIYAFSIDTLSVSSPNIIPDSIMVMGLALLICCALATYTLYSATSINNNDEIKAQIRSIFAKNNDSYDELLPTNRKEYFTFVGLVSMSAGVCEELIFRWYLLHFLEAYSNWIIACVISSVIFGFWHLYLGWMHVIKSAVVGFLLSLAYIYFDSILVVIVVHALMDIHAGTIAFVVKKPTSRVLIES